MSRPDAVGNEDAIAGYPPRSVRLLLADLADELLAGLGNRVAVARRTHDQAHVIAALDLTRAGVALLVAQRLAEGFRGRLAAVRQFILGVQDQEWRHPFVD